MLGTLGALKSIGDVTGGAAAPSTATSGSGRSGSNSGNVSVSTGGSSGGSASGISPWAIGTALAVVGLLGFVYLAKQ